MCFGDGRANNLGVGDKKFGDGMAKKFWVVGGKKKLGNWVRNILWGGVGKNFLE